MNTSKIKMKYGKSTRMISPNVARCCTKDIWRGTNDTRVDELRRISSSSVLPSIKLWNASLFVVGEDICSVIIFTFNKILFQRVCIYVILSFSLRHACACVIFIMYSFVLFSIRYRVEIEKSLTSAKIPSQLVLSNEILTVMSA